MKRMPSVLLSFVLVFASLPLIRAEAPKGWWSAEVEQVLVQAGKNRPELQRALQGVPENQRKGMAFLVANMPEKDLQSLKADFLLENVALAYQARRELAWGAKVPEEIFLNNVLPYANVDESRDPWRKELYERSLPLVKDCKTPSEAAQVLNTKLFPQLKVGYSTARKLPNQSPKESIEQGKASCTGLSILLSDACRSVAVPTRLAGTPLWANKSGNHTWVEIWDDGWHFTGACEPDPKGLDRGWFVGNAAEAKKDSREHAIYAVSFRKTDVTFPLVWAPNRKDVYAENVTDRYARPAAAKKEVKVLVRVWKPGRKERIALPLTLTPVAAPKQPLQGESRGDSADRNDVATFEVLPEREYRLQVGKPAQVEKTFKTTAEKEQTLEIELPAEKPSLTPEQRSRIEKEALAFFTAPQKVRAGWSADAALDRLVAADEAAVRETVWKVYRTAPIHEAEKKDYESNQVRFMTHVSPYVVREVGTRPAGGWPLVIAMHGGGGAPKEVNDSQWKIMQRYYRDQASVSGYKYLALRAPNDTWNGFYDTYVPPLVTNLIREFLLFGDVDSDKVYLIGYSHGGYGAFYIGPKIPDRFAAIHCSASAPTDGTISPLTLRNTRFTFMVGENDNAYGRRERCERFNKVVQELKEQNPGEFPVDFEFEKGYGHGGLPDRDKLKNMLGVTRNVVPRHLSWEMTDGFVKDFFWLMVPDSAPGKRLEAVVKGNQVTITTKGVRTAVLNLDRRLVDGKEPLEIRINGERSSVTVVPSFVTLCRTLLERGDPQLAFSCQVALAAGKE